MFNTKKYEPHKAFYGDECTVTDNRYFDLGSGGVSCVHSPNWSSQPHKTSSKRVLQICKRAQRTGLLD